MSLWSQFQAKGLPIKFVLTATWSYNFWGCLRLGRLCDQLWQPPPFLHLTNRNLPAFAPGACQPSSWQGADGWQTTSSSGNVAPFSSNARVSRLFSWFLPTDCSAMCYKWFFLCIPIPSYRSNLIQVYHIQAFCFLFLPAVPPHSPRYRPIILLLNSLPPSPSQLANIPRLLIPSCFSAGSPFLLMSVVSAHGAAPSQLNAALPSQTSNQSKEQSIVCCLMFIKAADIHPCTNYSTALQWLQHRQRLLIFAKLGGRWVRNAEVFVFNSTFIWNGKCEI